MEIVLGIIDIVATIFKIILMFYSGWKFLAGDKEKNSTLYYGILFIATLV
jgi:hypothetical protein|nr:MAG TPA: hypothetical protein [Caudoviricetes sp.]